MPILSASPHLKSKLTTPRVMLEVLLALAPATIASIIFFKYRACFLIANCVITALLTEDIILRIRKKTSEIKNMSAAVTGLLLALILPPSIAWYGATLGTIFAILVGKHLFGGLGANIFNPALIGRAFLMATYPKMLTTFIAPGSIDAVTSATPLTLWKFSKTLTSLTQLFWGNVAGSLGETSAICLIIGGIYLIIRKIADWRIPLSLCVTVTLIAGIRSAVCGSCVTGSALFHLLSGGLLLGMFFMATDPATTPITKRGRYLFGIACGIIIMVIRYLSGLPEGVMYSILFMNSLTPLMNRYTKPKRFGT